MQDLTLSPLFRDLERVMPFLEQGMAVLTPNRRLSRAVREAEQRTRRDSGERAWDTTTIMPLRQYWLELWQRAVTQGLLTPRIVLDTQAQRLLWRRIIAQDSEQFSLLSETRAAVLCQEAAERLALWQIDLDDPRMRQLFAFNEDTRVFRRWATGFQAALDELHALTPEQAVAELLHLPAALQEPVALLHLEDLPPLYASLCAAAPGCAEVAQGDAAAACLPTRVFSDSTGELEAVARWCAERARDNPQGRYAVVLSEMERDRDRLEFLLRREFACLTTDYDSLPVNFATGFTLDRLPIVRDALRILEAAREQVRVEDMIALLQSRFVAPLPLLADKIESSVRRLRELAREYVPQRALREVLGSAVDAQAERAPWELTALLEGREGLHRNRRPPSQWLAVFAQLLDAWGWGRGRALDSLEYQQLAHWQEALDALAGLDLVTGPLGFTDTLARLRELLAEQSFQPRTADSAIQVLGPLETTGLSFDGLWVTGLSAARWPASARPNPYLPNSLQREQRMPHADARWERGWAAQRWAHWMRGAGEFQASFVSQADGAEQLPSPLLRDIARLSEDEGSAIDPRWLAQREHARFEPVTPGRVPLGADERAAGGVGSHVLEQQALCPFQAFAASRLQATPSPGYAAGLLPAERGTLLHRALYQLFGVISDSDILLATQATRRQELIDDALAYAGSGIARTRRDVLGADVLALEMERLRALLQQWLALESERPEPFSVVEREGERELSLGGLELRLRVDRIDRITRDGSALVLDYKSGAPGSIRRWFEARPSRPQLPVYALLEPHPDGIAYASLKPGKLGFSGVAERPCVQGLEAAAGFIDGEDHEPGALPSMPVLREAWHRELTALAREFIDGESRVDPTVDGCRYCQRFSLCRIAEELA